ncbi:MAG: hypothetical protein K2K09_03935, partial [Lachnospiraceae bacterium]|nr:hypothetical protein [Lachnospiraceae bacterium]
MRDNEALARCAVNASMFNKHSDALVALEEKALDDRQYAESIYNYANNGLTGLNDKFDATRVVFSSNASNTNSVCLDTFIGSVLRHSTKIKGNSDILVSCNQDKELVISLKKYPINEEENVWSLAGYNYNGKEVRQVKYTAVINKGANAIEMKVGNNLSVPPSD